MIWLRHSDKVFNHFSNSLLNMKSAAMMRIFCFICCAVIVSSTMLKVECPLDEVHKSCSYYEEYTCWAKEDRMERVKTAPLRLPHCRSGCFCKKGFVREYQDGPCIQAAGCRDQKLKVLLDKLPQEAT